MLSSGSNKLTCIYTGTIPANSEDWKITCVWYLKLVVKHCDTLQMFSYNADIIYIITLHKNIKLVQTVALCLQKHVYINMREQI